MIRQTYYNNGIRQTTETAVSNHCQSTRPPLITQPFSPSMRHSMPSHTSLPVSSTMVSMVTDMDSLTPAQNKTPTQQFTHTTSGGVTLTDPPLENLPPLQNGLSSTVNPAAANLSDIARRQPTPGYPRAAATDMVTPLHSYESRDESDQKSCSLREPSLQASHSGFCGDFGIELEALKRQIDEMQQEHQRERETWQRREHEQQLREQAMQEQISRTQDQLERAIAHLQVNKSHGAPPPPGMRPSDPVDPHHRMYRETRGSRTDRSHDRGHGRSRSFDAPSSRRRRSKAYVNEAATDVGTQPDATDHHQTSSFPRSMRSSFHGHMPPATESYYPMPPPAPYLSSSYVPGRSKSSEETRKARQHKGRSPQSFPRRRTRGQMYNRSVNDYHSAVEDASEDDFSEHNDEADEARLLYNQYYRHPARSTHPPSAFYQQRSSSPPTYSQERPHRMYHEPSLPPERLFRDNGSWRSMPPELAASLDWPMHFPPSHLYGLPFAVAINGAAVNGDIPDGPIENPADPRYWNLPPQRQTSSQAHVSIY
ncbi:uncharacterized protein BYT42DRAFT_586951 [Radiomyces spectabilis]|uniref:uncharacterized protein n=1 Tax=Radiomyces spectabilis TaxID=64574 RepID=UPI00222095A5|nr:uncharacterized protein BYT42DRAFT_586951 [Radiomyces spectabilis]KAI8367639.1 hypothetical protein BYT42DRAFT_586951 [Radiomyces spectabilis]